jgi:magnesium transporter
MHVARCSIALRYNPGVAFFKKPEPPPGFRTGDLTVEPDHLPTRVTVLTYGDRDARETAIASADELANAIAKPGRHWVHVQGLGDSQWIQAVGKAFHLDRFVIEDISESRQRPKAEWIDERAFVILRAPYLTWRRTVALEQCSVILGDRYVLTVQETHSSLLQHPWDRVLAGHGEITELDSAYLFHAIVDAVVDSYYPPLERIGDQLEELEARVMESADEGLLAEVNQVRTELVNLRRVIWPQREAIQRLVRNEKSVLPKELETGLRDCYDHCLQVSEIIDSYRELVGAINGTYLSAVSNRTNEVMRVLTIMSSVFIPLSFIAGIYGMNFERMPELAMPYAYPAVWVVMAVTTLFMLYYFKRKGWIQIGGKDQDEEG